MRALSIDVALGVVAGAAFAGWAAAATLPPAWWILLPAATWALYSLDHLIDAARLGTRAGTARHRFHARHRRAIVAAVVPVVLLGPVAAVVGLSPRLLAGGAAVAAAALVHLAMAGARVGAWPKELSAAGVYAAAIWYAPLLDGRSPAGAIAALAVLHALAAFGNLVLCALLDADVDRRDGQPSFVTRHGSAAGRRLIVGAGALALAIAGVGAALAGVRLGVAFATLGAVAAVPAVLALRPEGPGRAARVAADLAFVALALPPLVAAAVGV